jgi:hypothetical protein
MWSSITDMLVMLVVAALKAAIKNPKSVATEGTIIAQIAQAATEADEAVNGASWSYAAPPVTKIA